MYVVNLYGNVCVLTTVKVKLYLTEVHCKKRTVVCLWSPQLHLGTPSAVVIKECARLL